jgi:prepilin-type processing-associated H-X9-DG protein
VKTAAIAQPSQIFLFIDESTVTINDGMFLVYGQPLGFNMKMNDWPATYHEGASGISFADGHADMHLWRYLGVPPAGYNPGFSGGDNIFGLAAKDVQALVKMATLPNSGSW